MRLEQFPYRPLLEEATKVINARGYDPYEAYGWLYTQQARQRLFPESYLSSSITSGGHARDESLEMADIIKRNTLSAALLAEQLANDRQINPKTAVEPVFVGKTHWNQAEYMEFWLSVIAGIEIGNTPGASIDLLRSAARKAFEAVELDVPMMVSRESAKTRAIEYFKMADAFGDMVTSGTLESRPVKQVVRLIDADLSLGAQSERVFARKIGTPVMNVCVVKPATVSELSAVNRRLARDAARLVSFGAAVFDTRHDHVRLLLEEDVA